MSFQTSEDYGKKVDIYALGLILFEMLYNCGSGMEKNKNWDAVKKQNHKEFEETFPKEVGIKLIT